jgi:aldehyde dehydrogenase (NAD+)
MTTTTKPIRIDRQLIDGELIPARGAKLIPATRADNGEVLAEAVMADEADAAAAVAAAKRALPAWSATSLGERRGYLQALADTFGERHGEMVTALVEEFGTPTATADAIASMSRDWFVLGQDLLVEDTFLERVGGATVNHLPVGVAVLITPWNGASWFMAMKGSVALAAGCTVVFKPSERGIWQVQPVIDAIADAGLPAGVVNVVIGEGTDVGVALTRHPDVDKISLTGSTATGKLVARNAVETMKRITLELGGKSPTVILDDADVDLAVPFALQAGFFNNGQACIAGTRILVPESRAEELRLALADAVSGVKVGDPTDPETVVGPLLDSAPVRQGAGLHQRCSGRGCRAAGRRSGSPRGAGGGRLRQADFARGGQRLDHRPRGGLRAGADPHHLPRRGGGRPSGQRNELRPPRLRRLRR